VDDVGVFEKYSSVVESDGARDIAGNGGRDWELIDLGDHRPPRDIDTPHGFFFFPFSRAWMPVGSSIPPPPSS